MGYCQLTGERFDAVASIGMVEHVGSVEIDRYAQRLGGLLSLGTAAEPRDRAPASRRPGRRTVLRARWFPRATPLHLSRVLPALARTGFATEHVYGFTTDYPETRTHWLTRLEDHLEEAVRLAGEQRVRVWGIYLRGAQRVPDGFHVGLPSPRAFVLKDWRLLPWARRGEPPCSSCSRQQSAVGRPRGHGPTRRPGSLERGRARPASGAPRPRGEHEHEPGVAARAHRRGARWLERREETDATGHAAAILRDLDLAVDDEQVGALVDLMFLWLLAAGRRMAIARVSSSERRTWA